MNITNFDATITNTATALKSTNMNDDPAVRDEELESLLTKAYQKLHKCVTEIGKFNEASRVGRNSPCPCGSGDKVKRCCASNDNLPSINKSRGIANSILRAFVSSH